MTLYFKSLDKQCDRCGKTFMVIHRAEYKYVLVIKGKKHYYCSYPCWIQAKEQLNRKPIRRMK